jgi:small-conductance mechanosensitive channel
MPAEILAAESDLLSHFTAGRLAAVALILVSTWLLIRLVTRALEALGTRSVRSRFLVKWLEPVLRIALWFAAAFLCVQLLAPSRDTFLAAMGSAAVAIGLGAQDLVKNLIGGLVVLADRPYQVGDRVRIGEAYGEVINIGLRSTKIVTPDDTCVTIPNADVLTHQVFNANSGAPDCQVVTDLFLPPDADVDEALRIGYEAAYTSPYVYLGKPVAVRLVDEFSETPQLRLRIKAYVYDHRLEPTLQTDVTTRAKRALRASGLLARWQRK